MGYTHGKKWTEEIIEIELKEIIEKFSMKTFPTHSELREYCGSKNISTAISKHGGTRYWAEKLNLPIKVCESEFGNDYELLAMKKIEELFGYKCIQTKPRYPYDLLINENIKIDVKVSRQFFTNCHTWQNTFNLEKKDPTCDIFILFCLDNSGNYLKTVILSSCCVSGRTQVGIGKNSKYNKFIDNWEVVKTYNEFYKNFEITI